MKKRFVFVIFLGLILILAFSYFAFAYHDNNENRNDRSGSEGNNGNGKDSNERSSDSNSNSGSSESSNSGKSEKKEIKIEQKQRIRDELGKLREIEVRIEKKEENGKIKSRIRIKEREIKSDLELEEENETDRSIRKIKARLSNGNKTDINLLPDKALEIAQLMLASENITNVSLELKEIKLKGNKLKAVYVATSNSTGKFLGIIKIKIKKQTEIDPETGEVIKFKKSWFAFLVVGEDDEKEDKKVTICHVPPGNPANNHTITVGRPAVRAHLRHGDYLGECVGQTTPPINNTNVTNPPLNNTNITLPPINNTNVTIIQNNTNATVPPTNNTNSTNTTS